MNINLVVTAKNKNQPDLYYYYHNWRAKKDNKVHIGGCKNCNYGFGMREKKTIGRNGVWVGPFATEELAINWAEKYSQKEMPVTVHSCIEKKK
jgi:hypothetical protein